MKAIFSDFDNTVYFGKDKDYTGLQRAVKAWQDAGNLFVMASGRSGPDLFPSYEVLGIEADGFVCAYGTMLYDKNKKLVSTKSNDNKTLLDFYDIVASYDYNYFAFTSEKGFFRYEDSKARITGLEEMGRLYNGCAGLKTEEDADSLTNRIKTEMSDRLKVVRQSVYFDFPPAGCGKSEGIYAFARLYGIKTEDIIAVGDWLNDLDMIEEFHGMTVENAHPRIKELASAIYPDMEHLIYDQIKKDC